jgi:hypothetical protein
MIRRFKILGLAILVLTNIGWSQTVSVPMSHWAYDAIERWEIQGLIATVFNGTRPMTRLEMAEYISETWKSYDMNYFIPGYKNYFKKHPSNYSIKFFTLTSEILSP